MIDNKEEIINIIPTFIASFVIVVSSSVGALVAVLCCVALDTLLGFWRVAKKYEKWCWQKFWNIGFKTIFYFFAIFCFFTIDGFLLNELIWDKSFKISFLAGKGISVFFAIRELRSVDKSVKNINAGKGLKYYVDIIIQNIKDYKDHYKDIKK